MKKYGRHSRIAVALLLIVMLLASIFAVTASAVDTEPAPDVEEYDKPWYTITYTPATDSEDAKIDVRIKTNFSEYSNITKDDLKELKDEVVSIIYDFAFDSVLGGKIEEEPELASTYSRRSSVHIPLFEEFLNNQLSGEEAKEKLDAVLSGKYDTLIELTVDKYIDVKGYTYEQMEAKVQQIISDAIQTIYAGDDVTIAEKTQAVSEKVTEIVDTVEEVKASGGKVSVSLEDLKTIDAIYIDGEALFADGYFRTQTVKNIIADLPTPSEIKDFSNDEMYLDYHVAAHFVFGTISADVSIGFEGDCEKIRKVMQILADHVVFDVKDDGTIYLSVNVPEKFAELLIKAIDSSELSDNIKHKAFSIISKNGGDVEAYIQSLTFDEIIEILEKIDFERVLTSEYISKYVDLSNLTNEQIVEKVAEYERYFNKAKDLAVKLFGKVPDKYMSKTLFDLYDADGRFYEKGSASFNVEKVLTSVSSQYGPLLASFVDVEDVDVSVEVEINFEKINRVTYMLGNNVHADGFLPEGADIKYFANITENNGETIIGWSTIDGTSYEQMPDYDVVLYAVYESGAFDVTISDNVTEIYDPTKTYTVSVTPVYITHNPSPTYTYVWYKNGEIINVTDSSFTVSDVADSGEYYCVVTVTDGTKEKTATSATVKVDISKYVFDMSGISFVDKTVTYNGNVQGIEIEGTLPAGLTVSYSAGGKNAGTYTITATFAAPDADNYVVPQAMTATLTIEKATFDMSGITFVDKTVTYDGTAHGIVITGTLPTGVTVTYSESKTNAGEYTFTATFAVEDTDNYVVPDAMTATLTIEKKAISLDGMVWDYDEVNNPFVYNGTEFTVTLTGIPAGITVSGYTGNTATNAGTYTANYTFEYDEENYAIEGTPVGALTWMVDKASYDMSGVSFTDVTVEFDGQYHNIELTGTLPAGLTVTYSDAQRVAGKYLVTATFENSNPNYYTPDPMTAILTIKPKDMTVEGITDFEYKDENGNVIIGVEVLEGLDDGTVMDVENKTSDYKDIDLSDLVGDGKRGTLGVAYDISFAIDGVTADVNGKSFTVRLLIPESLRDKETLKVIHIADSGEITDVESVREGNYMIFETNHFSVYAVVAVEDANDWLIWLLLAIILVLCIVIILLIVFRRRKKTDDENGDETPEDEPETAEAETDAAEEEEAPAEEAPAEEAPAEEAPAEEAPAEEAPAEEAPVEEATAEPAPVAPIIIANDDDSIIVGGEVIYVRYRSSFTSRLIQAEEVLQDYYTVIKNHILSYKGIKAKTSWNYELFSKGRTQCVKLNIKGKALTLELALDPKEYSITKYHFKDLSDSPKHEKLPMLMKVKSDRSLKYALELIDAVMATVGLEKTETPNNDYHMPYESNASLAKRGLVKLILPAGVTLDADSILREANVSEVIGDGNTASEEIILPEENTVAEEPVVEEAPVEEAPVEEAPAEITPEAIIPTIIGDDDKLVVDGNVIPIRYRSSFESRLIQAGDELQGYYTVIKNYLLSYKGVKSRMSWNYENFNKGRTQCARLNIKGKTLTLNLALTPEAYNVNKYHFTDMSDDPKFDKLPMLLKVRSDRALKYALELIDELMKSMEITQGAVPEVDYRQPYEANRVLAQRGLMKIILPAGVKIDANSILKEQNVDSILAEAAANAKETTVAEPVVEAPVAEPVVEEPVFVDVKEADEMVTDAVAEQRIENIDENVQRSGKLVEINIDVICENFENGETVTLEALKAKKLINKKAGRVKVLASGRMTKSLTVVADKFSIQAVKMITLAGGTVRKYN